MSTGAVQWSKTMAVDSGNSICSSCTIRGYDDFFIIVGYYNSLYQILILDSATGTARVRFTFGISVTMNPKETDSVYAVKDTGGGYRIGIIAKTSGSVTTYS